MCLGDFGNARVGNAGGRPSAIARAAPPTARAAWRPPGRATRRTPAARRAASPHERHGALEPRPPARPQAASVVRPGPRRARWGRPHRDIHLPLVGGRAETLRVADARGQTPAGPRGRSRWFSSRSIEARSNSVSRGTVPLASMRVTRRPMRSELASESGQRNESAGRRAATRWPRARDAAISSSR